jgi:hypothetical protein
MHLFSIFQELSALLPKDEDSKSDPVLKIKVKDETNSTLTPFAQLIAEKTISNVDNSKDKLRLAQGHIGFAGSQVIREVITITAS